MDLNQHRLWCALAPLLAAASALAQPAATVPASSQIYDRLESVSALYPVKGVFLGERALSRRELARVAEALGQRITADSGNLERQRWARDELDAVRDALSTAHGRIRGRYGSAGIHWRADMFSSRTASVRITNNALGQIDAVSNPYAYGRHGWPAIQGSIATLGPSAYWAPHDAFVAVVQPLASLTPIREEGWTSERFIQRGYLRATWHNVALQIGAEELRWGQSPTGSMFISGNAPPIPALALATDTAITLPWIFRYAGPFRMTALLGDLGGTQVPPHARLAAWQASVQPWSRFELGVAVAAQTGGDGGPQATFLERLIDLFPVIDALAPQHADLQFSNKFAGGNMRLRFPELSGLDVYYELQIDDFDGRRLRSSFVDDAGHLLGLRLPLIVGGDQLALRVEGHRTSIRLYEHTQFPSGYTYRQRLIGNPLGPHAVAGYASAEWRWTPHNAIGLAIGEESRDPSLYTVSVSGDRDRGFTFVRQTNEPGVRGRRFLLNVHHALPGGAVRATIGHHRAWRSGEPGRGDWGGIISFSSQKLQNF
ncbi:MAG TPA: capsule assembly Wzi family protein [Gemmatimonadaceae bacterium]|nr:capsule assembly Wzi family protein [Gemmatimonadaceae bacterium]